MTTSKGVGAQMDYKYLRISIEDSIGTIQIYRPEKRNAMDPDSWAELDDAIKQMNEDDKAAYRAYFAKKLAQFGVKSPADLQGDKKKEFFNAVDKGWKAKNEGWVNQIIKNETVKKKS